MNRLTGSSDMSRMIEFMKMKNIFLHASVLFSLAAFLACGERMSAQNLAVKTNALMWAALTPNAGLELVTGEHTSFDFSVFGHRNPYGMSSEVLGIQPEFRYWFSGRPMVREFIGVGALLATYDTVVGQKVFDGDALGVGLTGGYVFPLGKRWNLELSGSLGLVYYHQKKYSVGDSYDDYFVDGKPKANSRGYEILPIDLGVTFTYIIK